MHNHSPSIRQIHEAIQTMTNNGHGNIPALLRRIAKDLEANPLRPDSVVIRPAFGRDA